MTRLVNFSVVSARGRMVCEGGGESMIFSIGNLAVKRNGISLSNQSHTKQFENG